MKIHYTYRITNTKLNKHYYGCRTSKINPKLDLGIKYFSSSYNKEFMLDQKENPQDYKYKIIKIFDNRKDALELEIKLHAKFEVGINESFYNKAKQTSTGWDASGKKLKPETKLKISKTLTGRKRPEHSIKKIGKNNPMYGKYGKNNPKSFKYILYNKKEIIDICYGAEVKKLFKTYKIPTTFRYMNKPYLYTGNSKIEFKKFNGWYLETINEKSN